MKWGTYGQPPAYVARALAKEKRRRADYAKYLRGEELGSAFAQLCPSIEVINYHRHGIGDLQQILANHAKEQQARADREALLNARLAELGLTERFPTDGVAREPYIDGRNQDLEATAAAVLKRREDRLARIRQVEEAALQQGWTYRYEGKGCYVVRQYVDDGLGKLVDAVRLLVFGLRVEASRQPDWRHKIQFLLC
jgi:hypothetical protein